MVIPYGTELGLGPEKKLLEVIFDVDITSLSCRYCVSGLSFYPTTKQKRPGSSVEPLGRELIKIDLA
jgi:hypothetical protein